MRFVLLCPLVVKSSFQVPDGAMAGIATATVAWHHDDAVLLVRDVCDSIGESASTLSDFW